MKESDLFNKVTNIVLELFKSEYPATSKAATARKKKRKSEKSKKEKLNGKVKSESIEKYNKQLEMNKTPSVERTIRTDDLLV